jgi:hypothetical protein
LIHWLGLIPYRRYVLEANMTLPVTSASFQAANDRPWLVRFWQLEGKWVGISLPFGLVLFILFYFDANVSVSWSTYLIVDETTNCPRAEPCCTEPSSRTQSLIAQGSEFPLRKPPGFHWDFFLLGVTTFIAGLLGIPAPNGLIPQAPLHTASLVVLGYEDDDVTATNTPRSSPPSASANPKREDGGDDDNAIQLSDMEDGRAGSAKRLTKSVSQPVGSSERDVGGLGLGLRRRLSRSPEDQKRRASMREQRDKKREVPVAVVEQRVSNLAQGCLCEYNDRPTELDVPWQKAYRGGACWLAAPGLILMTKPFEHVLGLIPKGVLAGLFVSLRISGIGMDRTPLRLRVLRAELSRSGIWAPMPSCLPV